MTEARSVWQVNPDAAAKLVEDMKRWPDRNTPPWVAELREQLAAGGKLDFRFDAPTRSFRWRVIPA